MHSLTNSCHYCANKLIQNNSYRGNSTKEKIVCEKFSSSFVHKASQLIFHNNVPALSNSPNSCIYQVIESHFQIIVFHLKDGILWNKDHPFLFFCALTTSVPQIAAVTLRRYRYVMSRYSFSMLQCCSRFRQLLQKLTDRRLSENTTRNYLM